MRAALRKLDDDARAEAEEARCRKGSGSSAEGGVSFVSGGSAEGGVGFVSGGGHTEAAAPEGRTGCQRAASGEERAVDERSDDASGRGDARSEGSRGSMQSMQSSQGSSRDGSARLGDVDLATFLLLLERHTRREFHAIGAKIFSALQHPHGPAGGSFPRARVPWRELTAALATALNGSLSERLRLVFDAFDDGSGQLGLAQLMALASTLFRLKLYDPAAAATLPRKQPCTSPQSACSERCGERRDSCWPSDGGWQSSERSTHSLFSPVARARTSTPGAIAGALSTGAGKQRRGSACSSDPSPRPPRLRRVTTVCGGESFSNVQEQANDFLHQLLVMDVNKSGALSFDEWCQGVLSQPEVLVCFHLSLGAEPPASPATLIRSKMAKDSTPAKGGTQPSEVGRAAATAQPSQTVGVSLSAKLWWRALWLSVSCTGCTGGGGGGW